MSQTPNMTCDRSFLRSPPTDLDTIRASLGKIDTPASASEPAIRRARRSIALRCWRAYLARNTHLVSIRVEPIGGPLRRGAKLNRSKRRSAKHGRTPRSRCAAKAHRCARTPSPAEAQIDYLAGHEIVQHQTAGARTRHFHVDSCGRHAARIRMKLSACRIGVSGWPSAHRLSRLDDCVTVRGLTCCCATGATKPPAAASASPARSSASSCL